MSDKKTIGYDTNVEGLPTLGIVAVRATIPELDRSHTEFVDIPLPVQRLFGASLARRIAQAHKRLEKWVEEQVAMMSAMMEPVKPMFADFDVNQVQLSLEFRRVKARPSDELMARAQAIILEQAERELFSMFALPAEALQMTSDRGGSYVTAQAMREQIQAIRAVAPPDPLGPLDGLTTDEAMKRLTAACD